MGLVPLMILAEARMKYTFINKHGNQQTVQIDDNWINKQSRLLNITKREAINMWLSDEGYIDNETIAKLTAKAKDNKTGAIGSSTKPRKKPERKPDYVKRDLIALLDTALRDCDDLECGQVLKDVRVTNIERMIAFTVGEDQFELTLSKKRKPKN